MSLILGYSRKKGISGIRINEFVWTSQCSCFSIFANFLYNRNYMFKIIKLLNAYSPQDSLETFTDLYLVMYDQIFYLHFIHFQYLLFTASFNHNAYILTGIFKKDFSKGCGWEEFFSKKGIFIYLNIFNLN